MSKNRKEEIDFIESVNFRDRNKFIFKVLLNDDTFQKQNFSLFDVLYLFQNYPQNKEDLNFIYSLKLMYSILIKKLLVDKKYNEIITLINIRNIDFSQIEDLKNKNYVLKARKFIFNEEIAYKKMKSLFNSFITKDHKLQEFDLFLKSEIDNIIQAYLEIVEHKITLFFKKRKDLDQTVTEMLVRDIRHMKNNYLSNLVDDLNLGLENTIGKDKIPEEISFIIKNLYFLFKIKSESQAPISSLSDLIKVLKEIERYSNLKLNLSKETIKIYRKFINLEADYSLLDLILIYEKEKTQIFEKSDLFELFEFLYVYFRFLCKENLSNRYNFSKLIENLTENKDEYIKYLSRKTFYASEIPFIELFLYSLSNTSENLLLSPDEKWNDNEKSIFLKLKNWRCFGKETALPITSLDILDIIFLESYNLVGFKESEKDKEKDDFSQIIFKIYLGIVVSLFQIDEKNKITNFTFCFQHHPLVKPFFLESSKKFIYTNAFRFIFDEAVLEVKDE
jgi:hypothetical protein